MTTLSGPILVNRGNPERGFRNEFIIVGESNIEDKIKAMGWMGRTLVVTAILHMDEGDIMNTLLFLSGTRQVDKIGADLMFGTPRLLEALDLALFSIYGWSPAG